MAKSNTKTELTNWKQLSCSGNGKGIFPCRHCRINPGFIVNYNKKKVDLFNILPSNVSSEERIFMSVFPHKTLKY